MNKELQSVLTNVAKALNASDILWSVGASVLLYKYGLVDNPTDIDIIVSDQDIQQADQILSGLGVKQEESKSDIYLTDYFYEYSIDNVNIDAMSGFKIKLKEGVFDYKFDNLSVSNHFIIDGISIPLSSLEDWYILYQMMPDKEAKVNTVENYLKRNGIQHPELIFRLINNPSLPSYIKERVKSLIS